jgi:cysteine synthase
VYVYLARQPRHLDRAVTQGNWKHDLAFLREMIRSDEAALKIVREHIDETGIAEGIVGGIAGLFGGDGGYSMPTEEGVDYYQLAGKKDLIKKALLAKDWTAAPAQAAEFLGLNVFEADALARADDKAAKQMLWDAYHPYMVWIYLGGIGTLGTIGMILFYLSMPKQTTGNENAVAA